MYHLLGYMLDLLRTQGRNGAIALLEGLMIHYPVLYTHVTGRKPSTEPSRFSGKCFKTSPTLSKGVFVSNSSPAFSSSQV